MTLLEKMGIDLTTAEGLAKAMNISCDELPCYSKCVSVSALRYDHNICKARHLFEEISEIDWTKVPKDTKVIVWDKPENPKHRRYFSHCENGMFYCYDGGTTSWSKTSLLDWNHCELAEPVKKEWLKK